jgi:hypothetical protein
MEIFCGKKKRKYGSPKIKEKSLAPARNQTTISRSVRQPDPWRILLLVKIPKANNGKYY